MRYRNYGRKNYSFGGYFANKLYKGLKQNQNSNSSTNKFKIENFQNLINDNDDKPSHKHKSKKLIFIILCCVLILCVSIPFIVQYFEKQNIINQTIYLSEQCGLKDVEIESIDKNSEYDWYDVSIKCSNFDVFFFDEMQNIESIISKDYKIFIKNFISDGKKYEVFDDSIYIDGKRFSLAKEESEKTYRYWQGMNGTWTYRCEKKCSELCSLCRSCIKGRENFGAECTFQYSANSPIGWIGCPKCGDVDNTYWNKWYDEKLKS